jgi:hypothetical protein
MHHMQNLRALCSCVMISDTSRHARYSVFGRDKAPSYWFRHCPAEIIQTDTVSNLAPWRRLGFCAQVAPTYREQEPVTGIAVTGLDCNRPLGTGHRLIILDVTASYPAAFRPLPVINRRGCWELICPWRPLRRYLRGTVTVPCGQGADQHGWERWGKLRSKDVPNRHRHHASNKCEAVPCEASTQTRSVPCELVCTLRDRSFLALHISGHPWHPIHPPHRPFRVGGFQKEAQQAATAAAGPASSTFPGTPKTSTARGGTTNVPCRPTAASRQMHKCPPPETHGSASRPAELSEVDIEAPNLTWCDVLDLPTSIHCSPPALAYTANRTPGIGRAFAPRKKPAIRHQRLTPRAHGGTILSCPRLASSLTACS